MIYDIPSKDDPIDQGDIIDGCPLLSISSFNHEIFESKPESLETEGSFGRVVVLTQTCDLANRKTTAANVALVHDADVLIRQGLLNASDVRGPIRAGHQVPRSCWDAVLDGADKMTNFFLL